MKLGPKVLFASIAFALAVSASAKQRSFSENATPAQFAKWQDDTRQFFKDAIFNGAPPAAVPLNPRFGKKEDRGSYTIQEFYFHDRARHKVHGWLARPKQPAAAKLPAIIALHGHGGSAYKVFDPKTMYFYGDYFAQKGYIVLAIDIHHRTLTQGILPYNDTLPQKPMHEKFPSMRQRVWMVMRSIDLLQSLPDVAPDKIGIMGLSNGGITTEFAAAVDPRLKLAVSSGAAIMYDRMWDDWRLATKCQYVPKIEGHLDYYDVYALIAPRALIIQNGLKDNGFPVDSATPLFEHVKRAYTIAGVPDMAYFDVHNGAHEFRTEVPTVWVEKYLPLK